MGEKTPGNSGDVKGQPDTGNTGGGAEQPSSSSSTAKDIGHTAVEGAKKA